MPGLADPEGRQPGDCPFVFRLLSPPYVRPTRLRELRVVLEKEVADGTLVILRVLHPGNDVEALGRWIPFVRRHGPAAALIVEVPTRTGVQTGLEWARRSGLLHVDGIIQDGSWTPSNLRAVLTSLSRLTDRVVRWIDLRKVEELPRGVRAIVRRWLSARRRSEMKGSLNHVTRSVRRRLSDAGFPTPRRFVELGETLRAVMRIQGEPQTSIERIALQSGLSAASTLRRRTRRLFALPPSDFRGTLGWEWVVQRWMLKFCRDESVS